MRFSRKLIINFELARINNKNKHCNPIQSKYAKFYTNIYAADDH